MSSLVTNIRSGALWHFRGGITPEENKKQSTTLPLVRAELPTELIIPVKQHIGCAASLLVKKGKRVLKGQPLTEHSDDFMLPVHATTSGVIKAIEPRVTNHPSGFPELSVVITPDGEDKWTELTPCPDFYTLSADELIALIHRAGISGLGGAGFPTARKIHSGLNKTEILIINAVECEPYITADDMLMREHAGEIKTGLDILCHILKPELAVVAIEENKPEAVAALKQVMQGSDYVVQVIPTRYPSGSEKQLIKIITNKEVPVGRIPADIGIVVQNVGTLYAIRQAVVEGKPLIERVVTLTGTSFPQPRNVWARIGTPVEELLNQFDCQREETSKLIIGGPMMGFAAPSVAMPIVKTSNCLLALGPEETSEQSHHNPCIRCGQCAEVCPSGLLPQQLFWYAKDQNFKQCERLNLADCIECGSCAYVCPSQLPLVLYYRQAKSRLRQDKKEAQAAERAKQRFDAKQAALKLKE